MRPLDSSRLWRPFGKCLWGWKQPLPALLAWLSACHLHFILNCLAIQVSMLSLDYETKILFTGVVIPGTWTWVLSALWMPTPCCLNGILPWMKLMGAAGMDWNTSVGCLHQSGGNTRNRLCRRERFFLPFLRWIRIYFLQWMFLLQWQSQENPIYNAYERDIAVVNIFFGQSTAFGKSIWWKFYLSLAEFSRAEKMTWFDFASNIGGTTLCWWWWVDRQLLICRWDNWSHPRHQLRLYSWTFILGLH